jgi:hypothetical protein
VCIHVPVSCPRSSWFKSAVLYKSNFGERGPRESIVRENLVSRTSIVSSKYVDLRENEGEKRD